MNPQIFGVVMDRLYAAGALEVFYIAGADEEEPARHAADGRGAAGPSGRGWPTSSSARRRRSGCGTTRWSASACSGRSSRSTRRSAPVRFKVARRDGRVVNAVARVRRLREAGGGEQPAGQRSAGDRREGVRQPVMSRFFITTPIYYINAEPHLGHAYTTMVADAAARAHRLMGDDVFFLTGTDEHGQKVERAAQKAGLEPRAFADQVAQKFRDLLPTLNISNDDFIRTTEPRHHAAVAGAVAPASASAATSTRASTRAGTARSTRCSSRRRSSQDGRCPICGNAVERIAEESYFFRLSAFQQPLLDHYRNAPGVRDAEQRAATRCCRSSRRGLEDLSVSRTVVQVGHPGAGRSGARDVRVVRRADQLHDRGGIRQQRRGRRREVRALLAGGRAPDRQGDRPPARDLLAGVPAGRRTCRCRARSSATAGG